jgi:hypothetical protein
MFPWLGLIFILMPQLRMKNPTCGVCMAANLAACAESLQLRVFLPALIFGVSGPITVLAYNHGLPLDWIVFTAGNGYP